MPRRPSRPLVALLAAIALVASACGAGDDATSELADALSDLADESFAYALTLDLDSAAASELLGPDAGMAAGFVNSLELTGTRAEGAFSFTAGLMGFEPFSLRSYDDGRDLFLRVGMQEILASFGADLDALGLGQFADAPGALGELLSELFAGEWVGFVDLDPEAMAEQQADVEGYEAFQRFGEELRARLEDPEALLRDATVVTATDVAGGTRYDIDIRTEPALRELQELLEPLMSAFGEEADGADLEADLQEALAEAPEAIAGLSATVSGGDLTEVRFDLGALMASFDEAPADVAPGDVVVRLAFSEHGSATVPEPPADASTYTQQEMEALTEFFSDPPALADPGETGVDVGASLRATDIAQGLASLQLAYQSQHGTFTDDFGALFEAGPDGLSDTLPTQASYGLCLYDDGAGFVAGVEHEGETAYADDSLAVVETTEELGCQPELAPLETAA